MTAVGFCDLFERVHVNIQTPLLVTLLTLPWTPHYTSVTLSKHCGLYNQLIRVGGLLARLVEGGRWQAVSISLGHDDLA